MFFDPNILLFRLPPLLIHEDQNPLAILLHHQPGSFRRPQTFLLFHLSVHFYFLYSPYFFQSTTVSTFLQIFLTFLTEYFPFHRFETYFLLFVLTLYLFLLPSMVATSCLFIPPVLHFFVNILRQHSSYVNIFSSLSFIKCLLCCAYMFPKRKTIFHFSFSRIEYPRSPSHSC